MATVNNRNVTCIEAEQDRNFTMVNMFRIFDHDPSHRQYPDTSKNHGQGSDPGTLIHLRTMVRASDPGGTLIHLRNVARASEPVPCCLC